MDEPAMKTCPHCAEQVLAAASVCKHCGRRLDERNLRRGWAIGAVVVASALVFQGCQAQRMDDCRSDANVASLLGEKEPDCSWPIW